MPAGIHQEKSHAYFHDSILHYLKRENIYRTRSLNNPSSQSYHRKYRKSSIIPIGVILQFLGN